MTDKTHTIGVTISTTGDEHRLAFLETAVEKWWQALPTLLGHEIVLVIDTADDDAARNVVDRMWARFGHTLGKGPILTALRTDPSGPHGVAVAKNTGLEYLMAKKASHLFLADDDVYPRSSAALDLHMSLAEDVSNVCWGPHRLLHEGVKTARWSWPRGVVTYVYPHAARIVGGFREAFGRGYHEHVEFSSRAHAADLTSSEFVSPIEYAAAGAYGARAYWVAVDMPLPGEFLTRTAARKERHTTLRLSGDERAAATALLEKTRGVEEFVPYTAEENGRRPATLCWTTNREA